LSGGCGGDDPEPPSGAEVTVGQILRDPAAFADRAVVVQSASVVPLDPVGFVLEDDADRLLVSAVNPVSGLEAGEVVGVRGKVARFTEAGAKNLREQLRSGEVLGAHVDRARGPVHRLPGACGALTVSRPAQGHGQPGRRRALVALLAGGAAMLLNAALPLSRDGREDVSQEEARLAAVASEPRPPYGDVLTVAGDATRLGRRALVREADGEALLVVPQFDGGADGVEASDIVRATGELTRIPVGDAAIVGERELFDRFEGRPSLAATRIETVG